MSSWSQLAEMELGHLKAQPPTSYAMDVAAEQKRKPQFVGSEVRIRDDTIPTANHRHRRGGCLVA